MITKVYNNNVVQVTDSVNNQKILIGKGIGYQKKIGENVDQSLVTQEFIEKDSSKLSEIIEKTDPRILDVSSLIIEYAEKVLGKKLHKSIYLTLTDHLDFTLKRQKEGIQIKNMLLWDLKRFYRDEYAIALVALDMMEQELGIRLPDDEAGYIVFHIVNATYNVETHITQQITKLIQEIVQIIRYYFAILLDDSTMNYARLITHLKYFAYRIINKEPFDDNDIEIVVKDTYNDSYDCAVKIKEFIENKYDIKVDESELLYLSIHIHLILRDEKRNRIVTKKA